MNLWRESLVGLLARLVLAGEDPLLDRGKQIWPIHNSRQVGTTSGSIARKSALYFGWLETNEIFFPSQRVTGPQLLWCPLADADIERLPSPHHIGERLHRLLQRRGEVVAVRLVQVDVSRSATWSAMR
jgi:hypothetical protein